MRRGAAYGIHALATPLSEEHDALSHGRSVQTGAFMTFWFAIQTTCTVLYRYVGFAVPGSPAQGGRVPVKRHRGSRDAYRYMFCTVPVKRHRGEPGHTLTHGTHGAHGRTRAHGSHGRTSQPSTQTQRHTRTTTRRPKPRPTQQPQEQPHPQAQNRPGSPRPTTVQLYRFTFTLL